MMRIWKQAGLEISPVTSMTTMNEYDEYVHVDDRDTAAMNH
jgi:hypothetical protein